jgi:hypothetical protein
MEIKFQYTYHFYNKSNSFLTNNANTNSFFSDLISNQVLIEELIFHSSSRFDNVESKSNLFLAQNFSGCYKEQKPHEIEKTFVNYKKCFALIRLFDFFKLQVLFLGKPLLSELFFKNLSLKSRHLFLLNEDWLLGFLTKYVILLF